MKINATPLSTTAAMFFVAALSPSPVYAQLSIPDTVTSWEKGGQIAFALGLGGAAGGSVLGLAWAFGCLPEVTTEINKRLNRV